MKVGLLGGSFDPVHLGHIEIAREAIATLKLDQFYFIPTKNNPWKDETVAGNEDRVKMLEIATRNEPRMAVSRIEIDAPGDAKSYTYKTIRQLKNRHPETEFYFLMGMDQVTAYDEWKKADEIAEAVRLVAFNRGGYPEKHENIKKYHFIKMNNKEMTASSTAIKAGNLKMMDPEVLRYSSSHGLYLDTMIACRMKDKRYRHSLSVAKLTSQFAQNNGLNSLKGYIAGVLHDVAKEMDHDEADDLMRQYYPEYIDKPKPIWHQWLSSYVAHHEFYIDDEEILKAIEDHTTASLSISKLGKCLYCADKLDPLRGYDSSKEITICDQDIDQGFRDALTSFYDFSKSKGRKIDPVFYDIYKKFVGGNLNG